MAWLVRDEQVLASLDVADTRQARRTGLLGRDSYPEAVLLLRPCRSVHTLRMRFPIDVAHLDGDLRVLRIVTMRPWRFGRPVPRARAVIEAEAGTFGSWDLRPGDVLDVRD